MLPPLVDRRAARIATAQAEAERRGGAARHEAEVARAECARLAALLEENRQVAVEHAGDLSATQVRIS
eukprot:3461242-Pyramimonas_sp.AAC.1